MREPDAEILHYVRRAMQRTAAVVHQQMGQEVSSLATIVCVAPLVGVFGTVVAIANAFPGFVGQREAFRAITFERLGGSLGFTALGLVIALQALWCFRHLTGRLASIDREMENASLELLNSLRTYSPRFAPADGVKLPVEPPIFRDATGDELREERRPWYRSTLAVIGMIAAAWCVQVAYYFNDEALPLGSTISSACAYVLLTFAVYWLLAYPAWAKIWHRASGGRAMIGSLLCLVCSLVECYLGAHLW